MNKICSHCKQEKLIEEFGKNIRQDDGYHYNCKPCTNEQGNTAKYKHRYGITTEEKEAMIHAQHNRCAICDKEIESFSKGYLDHNHMTGQVRGILCNSCNLLLGVAEENIEILRKAIRYLETWNV